MEGGREEAIRHFEQAVQIAPRLRQPHYALAMIFSASGRPVEAEEHLRRGVRAQPGNGLFQYTLGELPARGGQDVEALRHLRKAAQLLPRHARAPTSGLAGVALQQSHAAAAVPWAEKANELTGYTRPFYLDTLADAYQAAGRAEEAARIRRKAGRGPS